MILRCVWLIGVVGCSIYAADQGDRLQDMPFGSLLSQVQERLNAMTTVPRSGVGSNLMALGIRIQRAFDGNQQDLAWLQAQRDRRTLEDLCASTVSDSAVWAVRTFFRACSFLLEDIRENTGSSISTSQDHIDALVAQGLREVESNRRMR